MLAPPPPATPLPSAAPGVRPAAGPRRRLPRPSAEWAYQLASLLICTGILVAGLRLDVADFSAPFTYEQDALLILPFVKEVVAKGSHWTTPRLGAPGIQELHDFPVIDHLHLAVIWLIGRVEPDPVAVFNWFYLLTYPLCAATALAVFRFYRLSPPVSVALAVLYAFQPYHYQRGQLHYFLSAYYMVPPTLWVALELCNGGGWFVGPEVGRAAKLWRGLLAALIGLAVSAAGAYYAFFSCIFLAAGGLYGAVAVAGWRARARVSLAAGFVLAAVVGGGVINHVPAFIYQYKNGENFRPRERFAEEAEIYGLKLAQMLLPVAGHNTLALGPVVLVDFASARSMYLSTAQKGLNESDWDAAGVVASAGLVGLLAMLCLPGARPFPAGAAAALALAAILFATTGGFGAVFNLLISPQVRCHNRISIFLAFLGLLASGLALDALARRVGKGGSEARAALLVALLTLGVGVWDQTNDQWFPDIRLNRPGAPTLADERDRVADHYYRDREFFAKVEAMMPEGAMLFTYPYMEYPEGQPYEEAGSAERVQSYDFMPAYLHTQSLRLSFGAMKGREWDTWMRDVSDKEPVPRRLERIALAGFDGMLILGRGVNTIRLAGLRREVEQYAGTSSLVAEYPERGFVLYDLRPYRESLRRTYGAADFAARSKAERTSPVALWLKGFSSFESPGYDHRAHWASRKGTLLLHNRLDEPATVNLSMRFQTAFKDTARLRVQSGLRSPEGEVWADELGIGPDEKSPEYARRVVLPPGRHLVRFTCRPDTVVLPSDSRDFLFVLRDFGMARPGDSPPAPPSGPTP